MQWSKTLLVVILAIILLTGCSIEKDCIVALPLLKIENKFIPSIVWHNLVGNGNGEYYSQLSMACDGSVVYAADRKGIVQAMTIDSGKILWSIDLSKSDDNGASTSSSLLSSGLTVTNEKIYIGTETGKIIALRKVDGKIEWKENIAGEALSQPVISDGLVLIHTGNGILQALDTQTGKSKWSIHLDISTLSVRGKSAPAIAYGIAIVGGDRGRISAVRLSQGEIVWQKYISEIHGANEIDRLHDINMKPVIDLNSGTIFVSEYNGDLVAINIRSQKIVWKRALGSVHDIAVANDIIYLVDQDDRVLAVRKNDGMTVWTQDDLLHRNLTSPAIYDIYLVVGDKEGNLHWLNTADGKFVARYKVNSSELHSCIIISSNKLLTQAKDGTVYLIKY